MKFLKEEERRDGIRRGGWINRNMVLCPWEITSYKYRNTNKFQIKTENTNLKRWQVQVWKFLIFPIGYYLIFVFLSFGVSKSLVANGQ